MERIFYRESPLVAEQEKERILQQAVELEKKLLKMKRAERVLQEMEQRYLCFMDSAVFLYIILSLDGTFRMMNRRAEEFFGFQLRPGADVTLQSLAGPGHAREAETMLRDSRKKPLHVSFPARCSDGTVGWLDMELFTSVYHGEACVQAVASDITTLTKGAAEPVSAPSLTETYALSILESCPELLCFAVDRSETLLYSTRSYREFSKRFMMNECRPGLLYPSKCDTIFAAELRGLIREAFLGRKTTSPLIEKGKDEDSRWDVTMAPLKGTDGIVGAVAHLTPAAVPPEAVPASSPDAERSRSNSPSFPDEFLNSVPGLFFIADDQGNCAEPNTRFLETLKLPRDEIAGRPFAELTLRGDPLNESFSGKFVQALRDNFAEALECRVCAGNGEVFFWSLRGARLRDGATVVACTDLTKLRRTEEQLRRVSTLDASTGILNRQGIERILFSEIERVSRHGGELCLILLDIDGFRDLNERLGYAACERILADLAAALKSRIDRTDFLGRWGGDEFMALTPQPPAAACLLAEKLRGMAAQGRFGEGKGESLTLSVGVAEYLKDTDAASWVASAYDAVTEARREGGNRVARGAGKVERVDAPRGI
jgi:diguanylate cyclase (GGDEF)-like protein/PAS domain S-box-containing protein